MSKQKIVALPKPEKTKRDQRLEKFLDSMEQSVSVCARGGDAWALWGVLENLMSLAASYAEEAAQ